MKKAIEKGSSGEYRVALVLGRLNRQYYRVFNNVLIRNNLTGTTSQIDHIIVSVFGVYVIETKNYEGLILGSAFDHSWLQITDASETEMYNPLRQNYGHIKALKSLLWDGVEVTSIVCFLDGVEVRVDSTTQIIKESNLEEVFYGQREMVMMLGQMDEIEDIIKLSMLSGTEIEREHGLNIKKAKEYSRLKGMNIHCPKCQRPAVLRGMDATPRFCYDFPRCEIKVSESIKRVSKG
jgi:DNA-binding FrmR family transcriptional regulator